MITRNINEVGSPLYRPRNGNNYGSLWVAILTDLNIEPEFDPRYTNFDTIRWIDHWCDGHRALVDRYKRAVHWDSLAYDGGVHCWFKCASEQELQMVALLVVRAAHLESKLGLYDGGRRNDWEPFEKWYFEVCDELKNKGSYQGYFWYVVLSDTLYAYPADPPKMGWGSCEQLQAAVNKNLEENWDKLSERVKKALTTTTGYVVTPEQIEKLLKMVNEKEVTFNDHSQNR